MHRVNIKRFLLGRFEVTFAEYDAFALATGRKRPDDQNWGRERRPVINVAWDNAQAYAQWLSERTGKRYRLPTESEWEYAARAGTTTRRWWGDEVGKNNANCDGCGSQWDYKQPSPVGSFQPNAFGLHDMLGNVWEWVQDCRHGNYEEAPSDGSTWEEQQGGDCTKRVFRGGSWFDGPGGARSADRGWGEPRARNFNLGFRLAQDI